MKVYRLIFCSILIAGATTACNQPTIEEEVDDVCECLKAAESASDFDKCQKKMESITDKYAFDPDASEDIKKRLSECTPK